MKKTLTVIFVIFILSIASRFTNTLLNTTKQTNNESVTIIHNNYSNLKPVNLNFMTLEIPDNWEIKDIKELNRNTYNKYIDEAKQRVSKADIYTQEEKKSVTDSLNQINVILFASSNKLTESIAVHILPDERIEFVKELLDLTNNDIKENYNELKNYFEEIYKVLIKYPTTVDDINIGVMDGKKYIHIKKIQTLNKSTKIESDEYMFLMGKMPLEIIISMANSNEVTDKIKNEILKSIKFKI